MVACVSGMRASTLWLTALQRNLMFRADRATLHRVGCIIVFDPVPTPVPCASAPHRSAAIIVSNAPDFDDTRKMVLLK